MTSGIAFFDMDRTLLAVNSASGWMKREVRLGHLSKLQAMRGAGWILAYHVGIANIERALHSAIGAMAGVDEEALRQRTLDYWDEALREQIRPGARDALARHRSMGHELVLLTSSTRYIAEIVIEALEMDAWLANCLEVEDGRFTGRSAIDPLCYGPGKVVHARRYAEERGVELDDCAFYTDSYSDLPALEVVGEPVLVAPDPRLAREGRKRGWRVEDWGP